MRFFHQRNRLFIGLLLATFVAAAARAQNSPPHFEIAAQDAETALTLFSDQSRLQVLFDFDAVQGIHTQAVTGQFRVADALGRLLSGTGLTFEVINERTISIVRDPEVLDGAMQAPLPTAKPAR